MSRDLPAICGICGKPSAPGVVRDGHDCTTMVFTHAPGAGGCECSVCLEYARRRRRDVVSDATERAVAAARKDQRDERDELLCLAGIQQVRDDGPPPAVPVTPGQMASLEALIAPESSGRPFGCGAMTLHPGRRCGDPADPADESVIFCPSCAFARAYRRSDTCSIPEQDRLRSWSSIDEANYTNALERHRVAVRHLRRIESEVMALTNEVQDLVEERYRRRDR